MKYSHLFSGGRYFWRGVFETIKGVRKSRERKLQLFQVPLCSGAQNVIYDSDFGAQFYTPGVQEAID